MRPTLHARDLCKRYGAKEAVRDVRLAVGPGEIVGLLGPNGAGKTTTFNIVVGRIRPTAGRVFLGEEEVTDLPMYQRARRGITYLPQEPSIFRKLTVEENILAILETLPMGRRERVEQLKSRGIGVSITDHNVRETLAICDRAYIIKDGDIIKQGPPDEIAADPRVREIYLGENFQLR